MIELKFEFLDGELEKAADRDLADVDINGFVLGLFQAKHKFLIGGIDFSPNACCLLDFAWGLGGAIEKLQQPGSSSRFGCLDIVYNMTFRRDDSGMVMVQEGYPTERRPWPVIHPGPKGSFDVHQAMVEPNIRSSAMVPFDELRTAVHGYLRDTRDYLLSKFPRLRDNDDFLETYSMMLGD